MTLIINWIPTVLDSYTVSILYSWYGSSMFSMTETQFYKSSHFYRVQIKIQRPVVSQKHQNSTTSKQAGWLCSSVVACSVSLQLVCYTHVLENGVLVPLVFLRPSSQVGLLVAGACSVCVLHSCLREWWWCYTSTSSVSSTEQPVLVAGACSVSLQLVCYTHVWCYTSTSSVSSTEQPGWLCSFPSWKLLMYSLHLSYPSLTSLSFSLTSPGPGVTSPIPMENPRFAA